MPSIKTTAQAGAEMNAMTDDAMALTVADATMQDWLTALEVIRTSPPPALSPSLHRSPATLSHPRIADFTMTARRPARRPVAPAVRRGADENESAVGGARTAYWLALAAALAVMLII